MPMHKFQPNEEQRRMVKALAGYGVKQRQIAALLDLASTTTLRKHFPEELRLGSLEAKAQMLGTLFKMAHLGRHPTMTMFWLKTRGGWSETGNQEAIEPDRHHQWWSRCISHRVIPNSRRGSKQACQACRKRRSGRNSLPHREG
jgi:hypothetical protein